MVFLDRSSKQILLPSVLVITDLQKTPIRNPSVDKQLRTLIDILIMFVFCFLFCFVSLEAVKFFFYVLECILKVCELTTTRPKAKILTTQNPSNEDVERSILYWKTKIK